MAQAKTIKVPFMSMKKIPIGFNTIYKDLGLILASLGILLPIFTAAAQSLPDIGIRVNASRLLK